MTINLCVKLMLSPSMKIDPFKCSDVCRKSMLVVSGGEPLNEEFRRIITDRDIAFATIID